MSEHDSLAAISTPKFDRIRAAINHLGAAPPQVMLFEGGTEASRWACALMWAARVNCQHLVGDAPCLACAACQQILSGEYADFLAYDGRISNREDSENPGLVRAMTADNVRELKARLGSAPHGPLRVVVLLGITQNRASAANALLKQLEEPTPTTRFVLLAPQREQLLPTLVSRSFCLSLPWPDRHAREATTEPWEDALADFLATGKGFLDKITARGAMDAALASAILLACQKSLTRVLASDLLPVALDRVFATMDTRGRILCSRWLGEAQDMLRNQVTPARVLEGFAMHAHVLLTSRS